VFALVQIIDFKELYEISPLKAHEKLLSIYNKTGSVRETARLLSCSPSTVSKWIKRTDLNNMSKAPKNPRKIIPDKHLDKLKTERKRTNLGRRRLSRHLKDNHGIILSENTCAYWLRKFNLAKPCKQRARYKGVSYYNHPELKPLQHWQVDTKDIRDSKTLPKDVYRHLIREKLPRYQFTAIDVKTRIKFISYCYSLNRSNGLAFMKFLISWLRAHNVNQRLFIQTDWGKEFGGHSPITWKFLQHNIFEPRNSELLKIRKARWTDNAYVERTHRTDDEEFYIPKLPDISTLDDLFKWSFGYIAYFNTKRPHYGKFLNGITPANMLSKSSNNSISKNVCFMPSILLDPISSNPLFLKNEANKQLASYRGVRDVVDTYLL
jgi:putative transposase